jgi:hypothetical protein
VVTICVASTPSRAITAPVRVAVAGCICAWPTQLDEAIAELDDTRDTAQRELAAIRNHGFARRREAVGDLYSGVPILVASDGNPLHEPAHKLAATLEGFGRISLDVLQVAGVRSQASVFCAASRSCSRAARSDSTDSIRFLTSGKAISSSDSSRPARPWTSRKMRDCLVHPCSETLD